MTIMAEQNGFGRWLKRLRAEHDLTQEMLAALIGCAVPTIRSFEVGRRRPSREMAERIVEVLKVPEQQRPEFLRLARLPIESGTNAQPQPRATETEPIEQPAPVSEPPMAVSQVTAPGVLIGRQAEIHTLHQWLQHEQQRMVTIVGPGGMGKTRLAQQVAAGCGRHFQHGAAFVSLAAVADGENVPTTLADGLGLALKQAVDVRERVLQLLSTREQLVVLDNFEHLLAPSTGSQASAIDFIQAILQRCAGVHLLVTSRERLRIGRERIFELAGLTTPKQQSNQPPSEQADAALLFVTRAQQVTGDFTLTTENHDAVTRICNLLDGMPLAIELAASWVRVLSCAEIADEIQRSLDFLVLADRDMPPRHRSMRIVFDQSWSLLNERERQVLAQMAIFRGGCRREAVTAVTGASLSILADLIDKSLLRKSQTGQATRYDMHELIRQYAEEQLRTMPVLSAATQQRHGEYYLHLLAARSEAINSVESRAVSDELNADIDNLRLAWEWAVINRKADLLQQIGFTMWIFLEKRALYREGEELFRRAAQMAETLRHEPATDRQLADLLWAHMTAHQGYFTFRQLRPVAASRLCAPVLTLLRQMVAPLILQQALFAHGGASWFHGDFAAAVADFQEGLALANQLQIPYLIGLHHVFLGATLYEVGEYAASFHYLSEGVRLDRQMGDPRSLAFSLSYANRTALALGRSVETTAGVEEAVAIARTADDSFCIILALEQQALLHQMKGEWTAAYERLSEANALARQIGDGWSRSRVLILLGQFALQQGDSATARHAFVEAYELARRAELLGHAVDALAGLAAWFAHQGDARRALTFAHLVLNHQASSHATRQRIRQLGEQVRPQLSADEVAAIQAHLSTMPLDTVVAEALAV